MSAGTVLLVEDNPITRRMLRVSLEIGGYDVLDAGDARTALEMAGLRRPDLLILDFVLPDMDGLQLLDEVRRKIGAPDVPAIIVTGMVSRLEELRARAGGSTHFLAKPVDPSRLLEVVRGQLASTEGRQGGKRILVVDDEALNLKLASFRLKRAGYQVETASGGEEALGIARRRAPDAILSDVMMPGMDGFSFARAAREEPLLRNVPIVLVSSAYVDEADRELARQMGASALVVRAPDFHDAIASLAEFLRGAPLPPSPPPGDESATALHRERLQIQLERQNSHNEKLLRQAAIQATALSLIRGLSEVLAQPRDVPHVLGDVLAHCLDAAGLSTGLLYLAEPGGHHRLQAQFGVPADRKRDAEEFFGHEPLMQRIVAGGQPLALSPGMAGADDETRDFLSRLGHSSALILPFVVLGETFGELVLASDDHDLTEEAWIGFARSLALQFGQTVALGQSLKRLAASEARYRALMEHANDAIFVLDAQGMILEANHQADSLLGVPRDLLVGRPISAFSPAPVGEAPEYVPRFGTALAAGGGRVDNVVLRRGDGALVEVDFAVSMSESDGKASILSVGREVTERNRAAAALRDVQQRLHHVVSSSPAVLYALRYEAKTLVSTWVSDNVERVTGYTADEVAGTRWWNDLVHPADRKMASAEIPTGDSAPGREYRVLRKEGGDRWIHDEQVLIEDADGRLEVIGSWSDVTARKEAEYRLGQSEEQYRLLFDSNPYPMWVIDLETLAFLAVNDAAVRHYGWTREEFLRMTPADLRPPEDVPRFMEAMAESRLNPEGPNVPLIARHRKRDGTEIDAEIVSTSIVFQGRHARLTLAADVTEKTALQDQLVKSQKMEAVGQLAGGVAHDFNNLLGVIIGYSELLMREVPDDSRERKRAEEIKRAADRAAALTRQLLAFSRRQVLQPKVLDLNEVVPEVEKMLRRLITENIQIVTVADASLGRVRADAGQIEQVLMNLAINARDAMPTGGRLVIETGNVELDETYVRTHPEAHAGRYVMLAVSDSGHGMDARTMSRIFEPFFTTKEEGKGTGLGLATVYGIVRQSGGTVNVYSEPGQGTAFKVYLPRVDDLAEATATDEIVPPPRGRETVLVVEDAEALRLLIRELLEDAGYTVLDTESPDKAIALVQSTTGPLDLVLTDMVMPQMNGQELSKRIAAVRPQTRVVFMSGYTDQFVGEAGTLEPGALFLQKPFTMEALLRTVHRALDS